MSSHTNGENFLNTSMQSSQALHQRGQRLTASLLFGSSPNTDESFGKGCLQPMLIFVKRLIQWIGMSSGGFSVYVGCHHILLRETQMRFVTCIVRERQLWLYGHVACFPDADPSHQILSARESHEWRRPMDWTYDSWLQQVDQHLKEMGMGQASTWGMARRRLLEYRQKVDAATHCSGTCFNTWPDLTCWEGEDEFLVWGWGRTNTGQSLEGLGVGGMRTFSNQELKLKKTNSSHCQTLYQIKLKFRTCIPHHD